MHKNREEELRNAQLKQLKDDRLQLSKLKMEEKTRFGNLVRYMNKQRCEFEEEQRIHDQTVQSALNEYAHDQENNLAREVSNLKREEIKQLKLR